MVLNIILMEEIDGTSGTFGCILMDMSSVFEIKPLSRSWLEGNVFKNL